LNDYMNLTREKINGIHYTPTDLAAFLAEQIVQHLPIHNGHIVVLDPACGDGELLSAFVHAMPEKARDRLLLVGYDTDRNATVEAAQSLSMLGVHGVDVRAADFLSLVAIDQSVSGGLFGQEPSDRPLHADVIISNPPYVRTQVLGATEAQRLARRFGLTGRVDLYHAFTIAMLSVLNPGGIIGLLTSNRFLFTKAGAFMRKMLRDQIELMAVFDLGDTKLFEAAVLPAILVGKHEPRSLSEACDFTRVYTSDDVAGRSQDIPSYTSVLEALREGREGVIQASTGSFKIEKGRLAMSPDSTDPWFLTSGQVDEWMKLVAGRTRYRFGDVAEIRVGIKTTADDIFIRNEWETLDETHRPEEHLLRPLLTHHVARRWKLPEAASTICKRVLYPHEVRDGKRYPIRLDNYPRAKRYLESHRERLEGRTYVIEGGRKWYEIWVPQDPSEWPRAKVVCPDISVKPCFFLDRDGAIVNGDCYWITLRPGFQEDWLLLILAVANSTFIEKFYDTMFHNKLYSGRRRFITQYTKEFPLPDIKSTIARRIVAQTRKLLESPDECSCLEVDIDADVWRAFGLQENGGQ
jgi:hypothetical protein